MNWIILAVIVIIFIVAMIIMWKDEDDNDDYDDDDHSWTFVALSKWSLYSGLNSSISGMMFESALPFIISLCSRVFLSLFDLRGLSILFSPRAVLVTMSGQIVKFFLCYQMIFFFFLHARAP